MWTVLRIQPETCKHDWVNSKCMNRFDLPQFHVVYDDGFTTVPLHLTDDHIKSEDWETLLMFNRMLSIDPDEPYELNEEWLSERDQEE